MSDTIIILGVIDLDPAKRDDAIAAANTLMEATHAEEGCEHYAFSADVNDPGRFYMSEQWASKATLDAHSASPHLAAFMGAMGTLGVSAASITQWTGATPTKLI